jgi:RNA polymerase sigma-70 factor, ECF subfamily
LTSDALRDLERLTRLSYGRLVAVLAARMGSLQDAQDALSEALVAALQTWPRTGAPDHPDAWLLTTARHRWTDMKRSDHVARRHADHLALLENERTEMQDGVFQDERLKLMFVCAHPSIDPPLRTPLILQAVLGLDAKRMASAFLVSPGTLGQRLTRAKHKIATAHISFEVPAVDALDDRLPDVLDAIYAAYSVGFDGIPVGDQKAVGLAEEALWLASLICQLLPEAAEAQGLHALMLFSQARRAARNDLATGRFMPLDKQDTDLWDHAMLADAETSLRKAGRNLTLGRYQLEAAIQAVHVARRTSGVTDWSQLFLLYEGLVRASPTVGAQTGHAVAIAEVYGAQQGLAALDAINEGMRASYQSWWAVRAHLCARIGNLDLALEAFDRAIGLSEDGAVRAYLFEERCKLDFTSVVPGLQTSKL